MGSSLSPPLRNSSYFVMSSLPLRFLASWQAKQFSLRMGATSLMKLTGPWRAAAPAPSAPAAEAGWGDRNSRARASASPRIGQSTHQQKRDRSMGGETP